MGRNLFLFFFSLVLVASSRLGIYQSRKERWSFSTNIVLSMNSSKLIFFVFFRTLHHGIVYRILLNGGELLHGLFYSSIIRPTIIYYPFLGGKKRKGKEKLFWQVVIYARCKGRSRSGVRVIEETIFLKEVRRVEKYILDGVLTSSKSDGDKILFKL